MKGYSKAQITDLLFTLIVSILLTILIFALLSFIGAIEVAKAEATTSVDISSTFIFFIETCFKDVIDPKLLDSCVKNINEKIYLKVNDTFANKVYEAQNTALYEKHTIYRAEFVYPVKYNNEIHPAKIEIQVRRFGFW